MAKDLKSRKGNPRTPEQEFSEEKSKAVIDKSLDLEKSREEMTPYFLARSRKLDFHFSFYSRFSRFLEKNSTSLLDLWDFYSHSLSILDFQDFKEKILFLFSIGEILKHKSLSLLDFQDFEKKFSFSSRCMRFLKTILFLFSIFKILETNTSKRGW